MVHGRLLRDEERGASLVEFSLVLPLLLLVLLGMVDFGLRIIDVHALEDGIRDAVREAAVGDVGTDTGCVVVGSTPPNSETLALVCLVKGRIGLPEADLRVSIGFGSGGPVEGEPILVCAQFPGESATGLLPEFGSSSVSARSVMRLEVDSDVQAFAETSLSGSWSECTL